MALARIISHSHQCSRELALDLLARGYAVEIVSPDAIPDNIADLELRVESGPGDLLTASVESHNGARSSSLDFVHHLRSPMSDFIRRPPERAEAISFPAASVYRKTEQSASDKTVEPIAKHAELLRDGLRRAPEPARPKPESPTPVNRAAPLIAVPNQLQKAEPQQSKKTNGAPRPAVSVHKSAAALKTKRAHTRNERWFWRAAVTFAGVVLVALVIAFGEHALPSLSGPAVSNPESFGADALARSGGDTAVLAGTPAISDPTLGLAAPEHLAVPAAASDARKTEAKSVEASRKSALPMVEATPPKRRHRTVRIQADDLVAPNTIVYFGDHGPKPMPVKQATHHGTRSPRQADGVIAASTVPDMSAKPASKAAKQK
jgi:hypothetical protein